jgi:hypothetical protein
LTENILTPGRRGKMFRGAGRLRGGSGLGNGVEKDEKAISYLT